ncbi:MAG: hypothetical protein JWN17_2985 [Frankiales bacterium]|nr:hypothetical protein [Frankiales bacterium]
MTESPFPFTPLDEAEAAEEAGGSNRRVLVLAGGVVAALALAATSFLVLGGSDDSTDVAVASPVVRTTRAVQPAVAQRAPVKAPAKLPVAFTEDLGRNPFKALYVAPAAAAGPATDPTLTGGAAVAPATGGTTTGSTTGSTTTGSGTGTGTAPSTGGSTPTTTGPAPVTPTAPTAREYSLVLKRVYGAGKDLTAEFTIDGRKQVAKVGVRFGPTSEIRLISLQEGPKTGQWTSVLQVGDGEPIDAVTGDRVSVR